MTHIARNQNNYTYFFFFEKGIISLGKKKNKNLGNFQNAKISTD